MATTIYGIKNCDTMKKARNWLESHGAAYAFHDYTASGIDKAGSRPEVMIRAPTTVHKASTEPTERSMPPVRITKVMPAASTVLMAI